MRDRYACRICGRPVSRGRAIWSRDEWSVVLCEPCEPDGSVLPPEDLRAAYAAQLYHTTTHPGAVDEAREIGALIRACDRVIERRSAAEIENRRDEEVARW